jgi:large subunit ribosomal protein L23
MEIDKVISYPLSTEKSIRLMESENKLIFVINKKAKNAEVKKAIESLFNTKVTKVNTYVNNKGEKRAYVKFSDETPAIDIATQLGLM